MQFNLKSCDHRSALAAAITDINKLKTFENVLFVVKLSDPPISEYTSINHTSLVINRPRYLSFKFHLPL